MACGSSFYSSSIARFGQSNLEKFIQCVSPIVPASSTSLSDHQNCMSDQSSTCQQACKDKVQYFTLSDLWECYSEWSAFGVGIPVLLNSGETIVQYYVPYLSALQIYSNKPVAASRSKRDYGDAIMEFESDSWSDDSGSDKLSRSLSNNSSRGWDVASEDSSFELESSSWPMRDNKLGYLYLHYVETCCPYWRPPLLEKVMELAQHHPALMTLKSVDLCPASWMAVAWYPIYNIPCRKNEKDLSASFLTYHTLSSSFQEENTSDLMGEESGQHNSGQISLPPFGLATYKMEGDLWLKQEASDFERVVNLHNAADSWLKQLNVYHHDFNYFTHHSAM